MRAMPKSMIFAGPPRTTMMLAGFTSRCTTPRLVRVRERFGDLGADVERGLRFDEPAREQALQLAPGDELHRHVDEVAGVADVEDRDDVRMAQAAGRLRFLVEALLVLRALLRVGGDVDRLDRDRAIEHRVGRPGRRRPSPRGRARRGGCSGRASAACSSRSRRQNPACLRKSFHIRRAFDGCSLRRLRRPLRALHPAPRRRRGERVAQCELLARSELQPQHERLLRRMPDLDRVPARRDLDPRERRRPAARHAVDDDLASTARSRARRRRAASPPARSSARRAPRSRREEAGDREAGEDERAPPRGRARGRPRRRRRRPGPRTSRARACAGSRRSGYRSGCRRAERSGSVGASASRKARETRIRPGPEKPAIAAPVATLSPARHGSPCSSWASRIAPWSTPMRSANGSAPSPRASRRTRRAASSASDGAARIAIARPSGASATIRSAGSSGATERVNRGVEPLAQVRLFDDGLAREVDDAEEHQARVCGVPVALACR